MDSVLCPDSDKLLKGEQPHAKDTEFRTDEKTPVQDGKLYFTKETERRILFFLTLIMLASGAAMKLF